jgi:hypothetical protein
MRMVSFAFNPSPALRKAVSKWVVLAFLLSASSAFAETMRVTAWDLEAQRNNATPGEADIEDSAAALGKLSPDVILLRRVRDWQTCAQLVQALKPANYHIVVCSAFRASQGTSTDPEQVAILAKTKAYFSWSEPWKSEQAIPGGFAFAAIQIGKRKVAFFSVQLDNKMFSALGGVPSSAAGAVQPFYVQQWQAEMDSLRNWTTNRIEAVVVAGAFDDKPEATDGASADRTRLLLEARLADQFLGAPLDATSSQYGPKREEDLAKAYFVARLAPNSQTLPGVVLDRVPATCELDLNPANAAASTPTRPDTLSEIPRLPAGPITRASVASNAGPINLQNPKSSIVATAPRLTWPGITLGILIAGSAAALFFAKRKSAATPATSAAETQRLQTGKAMASTETVVIVARPGTGSATDSAASSAPPRGAIHVEAPAMTQTQSGHWRQRALAAELEAKRATAVMRAGLIPLWGQWLKEKLVRRLMADRAELLEAQHAATLKVMAVDERLAKVELQIQRQNQVYERRIEELTRELLVAKEGQRELIRAQIDRVKAEMDSARARALAQSKEKEAL